MPIRALLAASVVALTPLAVQAQVPAPTVGPITIGQSDTLHSGVLKETRPYMVYLPPSYTDTTYLPRTYPVLYVLDGDTHFHSVSGLIQFLGGGENGNYVIPEMIVVAIPNTDRTRDLTPTHVATGYDGKPDPGSATSGGMGPFLQFIKTELIPHIDSTYRVAPYRVFIGHSLGGITAINALYTMPETFNAFIAIDPSLWWDSNLLLRKAKAWATGAQLTNRALFVGQANTIAADDTLVNQHFNAIAQFNGILETYKPAGLRYGYQYYPHDSHGSVPLMTEYDALRFIFASYNGDLFRGLDQPGYPVAHFAKVSQDLGYTVLPPESMLDLLGQFEMTRDSIKGVNLRKVATEVYPKSPHAWVMLGNGLLANGDAGQAKKAYERALAFRPGYGAAVEGLKKVANGK